MQDSSPQGRSPGAERARARDPLSALVLAEARICERVLLSGLDLTLPCAENAFGAPVAASLGEAATMTAALEEALAAGIRATLVAPAASLGTVRGTLRSIAQRRLPAVVHAIADRGSAEAHGLADLGWGLFFSSGVEDAIDMSLIARRAAEDAGTPFFVVHERGHARHVEAVLAPPNDLCEVFVGPPSARLRNLADLAHPSHAEVSDRAFAERVPFAVTSAMRELESLTGRRHEVIERIPEGDAHVVMVGMGEVGENLLGAVERLRAAGHDVGAVKVNVFRPFPGARLVKVLSRASAVSILESVDQPLAQSNPLTREVKAAFADALTWAPDYPGVGKIPRIASGIAHTGSHEITAEDVDAIVHNMFAGEDRLKRSFAFASDPAHALDRPPSIAPAHAERPLSIRGRVRDARTAEACVELCASVMASTLGLRVRGAVRPLAEAEGEGLAFDLFAARKRPRGVHPPHAAGLVLLEEGKALLRGNPLARLADGGVVALPTQQTTPEGVWGELPPYAKAIVFDRGGRVVGVQPPQLGGVPESDVPWLSAAVSVGVALFVAAGRRGLDPAAVAREVCESLGVVLGPAHEDLAVRGGKAARAAFEAALEVPRTVIERDEESVRLGRRDGRAAR